MLWSGRGPKNYASMRQVVGKGAVGISVNTKTVLFLNDETIIICRQVAMITRKDGLLGFYRGVFTNLLTTVCGSLLLVSYDLIKERYDKFEESKVYDLRISDDPRFTSLNYVFRKAASKS